MNWFEARTAASASTEKLQVLTCLYVYIEQDYVVCRGVAHDCGNVNNGCSSADCSGGDRSPVYGPDLVKGESFYVNVIRREDLRDRV